MDTLKIQKLNEVYLRIRSDEPSVLREMSGHFTFEVPGYRFMPSYKHGTWDGKIRLFNAQDGTIYAGLVSYINTFAKERDYIVEYEEGVDGVDENFSAHEADEFIKELNIPSDLIPKVYDYQIEAFVSAVRKRRMLLLSPTGSGKSLIIYLLTRFYLKAQNKKILIIVPTTSLVAQMTKDFEEYGLGNSANKVHQIMSGQSKETESPIVISTWQSLFRLRKKYFEQFGMVVVDECHGVKAKSLMGILTKTPNIKYRFGTTGTLDGMQTNKLVIEGLLGPVRKVIGTKTLIDKKVLSDFIVKAIILKHEERVPLRVKYQEEIDYLIENKQRNGFIKNLILGLEGNTLVLFNYIEKHGVPLFDAVQDGVLSDDRKVFFVHGGTNVNDREAIRSQVEQEENAIIIASVGVYSTGINIKRLNNVVFVHPGKSRIRTLQSIGRALRRSSEDEDERAVLYDIVDDLSCGRKTRNFALKHYQDRFEIYKSEKFKVKSYNIKLPKATSTKKGNLL
jgi:superfamily II DNA or RNA helicase